MSLLMQSESMHANVIQGVRYDIGNKMDYLKTIVRYGLKRKEFSGKFKAFLKELVNEFDDEPKKEQ